MALKKTDIIKSIQDRLGFSKEQAAALFESTLELIKQSLEKGEEVKISGFGKFYVIEKKARNGRNPQTGKPMIIAPRRVVSFRYSSRARDGLNN